LDKLTKYLVESVLLTEDTKIKKIVGIYGGRFQPFGPHHLKTYKWLKSQVDDAYITTSDLKKPPRHPMNFKEKVRHMTKMSVPSSKIIFEKSPYNAKNLAKKYDSETTAFVYVFGQKDAGRLGGSGKYFQDYKKNKKNLKGFEENGYYLVAPHVSLNVGGKEVSGTSMRQLLGSPKIDDSAREKLFKKMFGYFDKGVFQMMTNKFKKLFEVNEIEVPIKVGDTVLMGKFKNKKVVVKSVGFNEKGDMIINGKSASKFRLIPQPNIFDGKKIKEFLTTIDLRKIIKEASSTNVSVGGNSQGVDDGPRYHYGNKNTYKKKTKEIANKFGWEVINYIVGDGTEIFDHKTEYPDGPVGDVSFAPSGIGSGGIDSRSERTHHTGQRAFHAYFTHINSVAEILGYEVLDYLGAELVAKHSLGQDDIVDEIPEETPENRKDIQEKIFSKEWWEKELMLEGGAYGHMAHPFDDKNLKFSDLKKIIENGLGGNLSREDNVTEKLDGQNLMISWIDGKLRVARNKGHLKNFGKTSLTASGIKSKFEGRGEIANAFNFAVNDMTKAIGSLSDKQKMKIFNNGQNWMNLEVMWPASSNVVDYDIATIVFHGALIYDKSGNAIGDVPGSGRMLAGMIKQVNQHIQKKYSIGAPNFLKVPKHQDFGKLKAKFLNKLAVLKAEFMLKDSDTLAMYHQKYWDWFIRKELRDNFNYAISDKVVKGLVKRWAFFDKSYSVANIKSDITDEKFLEWVLSFDKNDHAKMVKENMKPFEVLFFEVGAEILKNVEGFIAANPDKSVQSLRSGIKKAISDLKSGGDVKKLARLKTQLDRFEAIGGAKSIVPSEGIVFKYKGKVYKFTGAFAPVNQIMGLLTF